MRIFGEMGGKLYFCVGVCVWMCVCVCAGCMLDMYS